MNKRTFRDRVLTWFLAFLSFFTVLVLAGVLLVSRQNAGIDEVVQHINRLYDLYLEYHTHQTGFINFDQNTPDFYRTGRGEYETKAREKKKEIDQAISSLKQEKLYYKFKISRAIENLEQKIHEHDSLFIELMKQQSIKGFKDWGLIGKMRDEIHDLEDNYPFLSEATILMLRRHEKDYIIRGEENYINKMNRLGVSFRQSILDRRDISELQKQEVCSILDQYLEYFNQMVELDQKIGIKDDRGGLWTLMETKYQSITNDFTALKSMISAKQSSLYLNLRIMALAISVIFLLLSIFISNYFTKWLTAPLQEFTSYITRMGKSNFKLEPQEARKKSEVEIYTLYAEFNEMVRSLKERELENIKANQALAYSEGKFKEMTDMLPISVYETDDRGVFTYVNSAWRRQFGYTGEDLKRGVRIDQILFMDDQEDLFSLKQVRNKEVTGIRKSKSQFSALFFKNPRCIGNDLLGFRGIIIDNTEIRQTMEELKAQKLKAEESDRLKTAFLTNMSHEIRTPMNSIIGFSHLLSSPGITNETRDGYVNHIQESGEILLKLINDILDLAKIEAGEISLNLENCNIDKLLDDLHSSFCESIPPEKKLLQIRLVKDLPGEELVVQTDPLRMRQILTNLISNALKFTHEGHVEFGYIIDNTRQIQYYVKDTGIGIPKDKVDVIFDRFRQIEDSLTREHGGTGLGLSITRNLVDLLGGRIQIESEQNKGTTFRIIMPLLRDKSVQLKEIMQDLSEDSYQWKASQLLLVEDTRVNYLYIKEVLKDTGMHIVWAKNGQEAIEFCRKMKELDIVLMDIQMPVMNGFDATRAIKSFRPALPVIAQTAYAMTEERTKCMAAGCDDYLAKPILPAELKASICRLLQKQENLPV